MGLIEALILAVVQGLTEFLPVSSSGHLTIFQNLSESFEEPGLTYDILLHMGTLIAVGIYFKEEIINICRGLVTGEDSRQNITESPRKVALWIALACIPTALIGFAGKKYVISASESIKWVGFFLICTGIVLFFTGFVRSEGRRFLRWYHPLIIGIAQGLAVLPGISRSGLTISVALFLGIERSYSARFSFLISIPAIFGANLLEINEFIRLSSESLLVYLTGMTVAAVVGIGAIHLVMKAVEELKFNLFSYYCLILGGCILIFF